MTGCALVSVVIPVFQVGEYLKRCVNSILEQTHTNLQVILIDDGSTDDSPEICDEYAKQDARVEVVHQSNSGLSAARNRGIDASVGHWITFVDSDDWLHRDMLRRLLSVTSEKTDVAVADFLRVSDETSIQSDTPAGTATIFSQPEVLKAFLGSQHTRLTISCAKIYRHHLFAGIRFPNGRLHEDEFTTYRLLGAARQVVLLDQPLYYYFSNPRSITGAGLTINNRRDVVDAIVEQVHYFQAIDHDLEATARITLLRKQYQLHNALFEAGRSSEADVVAEGMRANLRAIPFTRNNLGALVFGHAFVHAPQITAWLNRARGWPRNTRSATGPGSVR